MPSVILERMKRPSNPDLGNDYAVHAICFNCWIGINKNVDLWRAGNGSRRARTITLVRIR